MRRSGSPRGARRAAGPRCSRRAAAGPGGLRRSRVVPDGQEDLEARALPELAVDADEALLHQHEPPRDREAEPGAASPDALLLGLLVLLEDDRALLRADAGARVAHAEAREAGVVADVDHDLALLGELDRVSDE